MNFKKIASCFLATAAICMTFSLTGCRKDDGKVEDNASHTTDDARHTDGIFTDDHMTNNHSASATPAATPTMLP